jgi:hypothetical protein
MRFQHATTFSVAAMIGLLLSSFFVILGGMSHVEAQETSSSEVSIASGSNRFVVWRDTIGVGTGDIYFRRSTDNGATWNPAVNLSNNPGFSGTPKIAVSGSNVYVAWEQVDDPSTSYDILFRRSSDNGATWGDKIKITPGGTCNSSSCHQLDILAASGSSAYLVTEFNGEIYLRRSSDNGASWKSPVNISSNPGSSFDPEIAVLGTNVYLAWTQANAANTSNDILFRRSTDAGATWQSKVNLSSDPENSRNSEIATIGASVYVVWERLIPNEVNGSLNNEIVFKRSLNNGANWQAVHTISNSPAEESTQPELSVVGSNVYLAWKDNVVDETKHGDADIFFRRSIDGGSSWEHIIKVGHADSNYGSDCIKLELAGSGTGVYVVWTALGGCDSSLSIFFNHSNDSGQTWTLPEQLAGYTVRSKAGDEIGRPLLEASGNTVYLVMTKKMSGPGTDIFFGRSTNSGQSWSIPVNLSRTSGVSDEPQFAL